jgi:hypothetical protein
MRVDISCSDALHNGCMGVIGDLLFKPAAIVSPGWGYRLLSGFRYCSGFASASSESGYDLHRNLCRCFNLVAFHPTEQ